MLHLRMVLSVLCLVGVIALSGPTYGGGEKNADYSVIIKNVEVMTTNANGNSWDINDGKPDLMVIVRNSSQANSEEYKSKERTDTFQAEFNEPTNIKLRLDQTLEIQVVDVDVAANDEIGRTSVKVTDAHLKDGLKIENFGRVKTLVLHFKKL